jgi:hypothetical protein
MAHLQYQATQYIPAIGQPRVCSLLIGETMPLQSPLNWPLDPSDRPTILDLDPDGEIVAVDVERDVNVFGV